ncbi:unnamed protein product, partial [Callosobruchus maculatus]
QISLLKYLLFRNWCDITLFITFGNLCGVFYTSTNSHPSYVVPGRNDMEISYNLIAVFIDTY